MSVRWSEGKTMTFDEGGSEIQQVWVCVLCERQRGALGFRQGGNKVRAKWGWFGLKQGQRRDVQMQRRNVPKRKTSNFVTLRSNIATFQRVMKTNVATLRSNVATFQRSTKMTSRRWDPTSRRSRGGLIQRRDVGIQRHDVPEIGQTDVATLKRRDVESQHRDVIEKA